MFSSVLIIYFCINTNDGGNEENINFETQKKPSSNSERFF